jgi:hypothetical protein
MMLGVFVGSTAIALTGTSGRSEEISVQVAAPPSPLTVRKMCPGLVGVLGLNPEYPTRAVLPVGSPGDTSIQVTHRLGSGLAAVSRTFQVATPDPSMFADDSTRPSDAPV